MPLEPIDLLHLGNERVIGVDLVETPEGPALFDCGPATRFERLREAVDLREIRHLLLSHIHLDHAGSGGARRRGEPADQQDERSAATEHGGGRDMARRPPHRDLWSSDGRAVEVFIACDSALRLCQRPGDQQQERRDRERHQSELPAQMRDHRRHGDQQHGGGGCREQAIEQDGGDYSSNT